MEVQEVWIADPAESPQCCHPFLGFGWGSAWAPHTGMHVACPQVSKVHPGCCQAKGADTDRDPPPVCPAMTVLSKSRHLGLRFTQQPFEGWLAQRVLPGLASATLRRGHGAAGLRTALVRAAILCLPGLKPV